MKRYLSVILAAIILSVCLCGCESDESAALRHLNNDLGTDISEKQISSYSDTHGGFLGDGELRITVEPDGDFQADVILKSDVWKPLGEDETAYGVLYGTDSVAPMFPILPEPEHAWCWFNDRHTDTQTPFFARNSYNFTIAVYDSDTGTLYYYRLDT